MWLHVASSIATTAVLCAALPRLRGRPHRDRLIAAFGAALIVGGSALSFLYTRDRIGLPVGIGYAMVMYVALSTMLEQRRTVRGTAAVAAVTIALGICWTIRTAEMYVTLRDTALDYHSEWNRPEAIAAASEQTVVARMRSAALQQQPPDSFADPEWTFKVFERRFQPAFLNRED
jgi:hypothetical protein